MPQGGESQFPIAATGSTAWSGVACQPVMHVLGDAGLATEGLEAVPQAVEGKSTLTDTCARGGAQPSSKPLREVAAAPAVVVAYEPPEQPDLAGTKQPVPVAQARGLAQIAMDGHDASAAGGPEPLALDLVADVEQPALVDTLDVA